ncbi:predicted protein [Naegleria gruberi]|uniref:non-specific serine/threonine protein kinase n=1 Tax=Naegleria gruberi TaxID=5762 RepID=D2VS32_NAEGR|nr:uncharacterized protein NAEGRDRAFT_51810 [Naegleria gruberi]EFC40350.1 predicted protein [Naegleria gruberi]|eukprot:XP_002673094.1 predicted protein [Naegleria gruberi strain NEG-M]
MQKYAFKKEEMTKYSKVMGISYLQRVVYLFILEANFEEVNYQKELLIVPKYSIYMHQYSTRPVQMLKLFLDIGYFIQHYVPKDIGSEMRPYRPALETPFKNQVGLIDELTTDRKIKPHKRMKQYKQVVGVVNNSEDIYIVRTTSVIKDVNNEERNIIMRLVNRKEYCLYLPQVLNIYSNSVEFEKLQSINEDDCNESYLLKLASDISIAMGFLHANKIVHRDIKPSNIMKRSFNNASNISCFVLIDFGVSFEIEEDEKGYYYEVRENETVLANENVGTLLFKSPEVSQELNYNEKVDIYSLGASLLYLKNRTVFTAVFENAMDEENINLHLIMKTIKWDITEFGVMVLKMVDSDPQNRPSAKDLESFFTDLYTKNNSGEN